MATLADGKVVQVIGPVIDVEFPADGVPDIYTALKEIFATARREKIAPEVAADQVAEHRLAEARARRQGMVSDPAPSS